MSEGRRAADTVADLVAECFAAIVRHAGEDRDDVARLLLQEATRKLRTVRRAQHRYQERTVPMPAAHDGWATTDLAASRSSAEWLAVALTDAVRSQSLTRRPGPARVRHPGQGRARQRGRAASTG